MARAVSVRLAWFGRPMENLVAVELLRREGPLQVGGSLWGTCTTGWYQGNEVDLVVERGRASKSGYR